MTTAQLSAASLTSPNTNTQTSALPATPSTGSGIHWALAAFAAGGLIIVVALIWQIASRRSSSSIRKPPDTRFKKQSRAEFCRNCGEPTGEDDRFCSGCGSEL